LISGNTVQPVCKCAKGYYQTTYLTAIGNSSCASKCQANAQPDANGICECLPSTVRSSSDACQC